jgi:hypothetical protein
MNDLQTMQHFLFCHVFVQSQAFFPDERFSLTTKIAEENLARDVHSS